MNRQFVLFLFFLSPLSQGRVTRFELQGCNCAADVGGKMTTQYLFIGITQGTLVTDVDFEKMTTFNFWFPNLYPSQPWEMQTWRNLWNIGFFWTYFSTQSLLRRPVIGTLLPASVGQCRKQLGHNFENSSYQNRSFTNRALPFTRKAFYSKIYP